MQQVKAQTTSFEDGVLRTENFYESAGTFTYVKSANNIKKIDVVVQGGGGGGGFINHGANNGGAGGGGATAETLQFDVSKITSATYVVGGGGAIGNSGARYGGTGGASSFTCTGLNMSAGGGGGGAGGSNNTPYGGGGGGAATGGLTRNMNGYNAQGSSNTSNDYGGNPGCGNEFGGTGRILSGGSVVKGPSRGGGGLGGDQKPSQSGGSGGFVLIREYS